MRVIGVMGLVVVVGLVVAFCGGAVPEVRVDVGPDVGLAAEPGAEMVGVSGSEERADAARPEAVDRELIPVAMCTMTGQVIDSAGKRVVGAVAIERVGSDGEKVTVDTDGAGGFEVRLPDVGGALRIVASAPGARRGERVVEVPAGSRERNLGVVVVHHFVRLTVRLRVGAAQRELLGGEGEVRAQIVHQGAGLAGFVAPSVIAEFPLARAGLEESVMDLPCRSGAAVQWRYRAPNGRDLPLEFHPVPEHAHEFVSECTIGPRGLLLGRVVSAKGDGLPGVVVQVFVDSPQQQFWELSTDGSGNFVAPIASEAVGRVRAKLPHLASRDMSVGMVPWSPGEPITLTVDLDRFVRLRVRMHGKPVPRFAVVTHNDPHRGDDGRVRLRELVEVGGDGVLVSEFELLSPGQRLFVQVPWSDGRGGREFAHEVTRTWGPSDGVYDVDLTAPLGGRVGLRLPAGVPQPGKLSVTLEELRPQGWPASYRFTVLATLSSQGWIAEQIVPGRYRGTIFVDRQGRDFELEVRDGEVSWVDVRAK